MGHYALTLVQVAVSRKRKKEKKGKIVLVYFRSQEWKYIRALCN